MEEKLVMPIKRYKPEQIVTMLRQIEVSIANGKTTPARPAPKSRTSSGVISATRITVSSTVNELFE